MKHKIITIISVFVILAQTLFAAETNQATSSKYKEKGIEVSIRFYNKTVYYPDGTENNPVKVHITISNNGTEPFRFRLSDDRMFSIDFKAYTASRSNLAFQSALSEKRTTSRTVYFREITLESGEEYSFIENLKDYVFIDKPGVYYFEVYFYPELYKSKQEQIVSNSLSLDVRPAPSASSSKLYVASSTAETLKPKEISPDKVVEWTINARQRDSWDEFFLYFDIEQMFKNDDIRKMRYDNASEVARQTMIESYKETLKQDKNDNIVAVPKTYSIEKTEYSKLEGTVTVIEKFEEETFTRKKEYVYKLRQRDGIWQIYDYVVTNLESE